MSDEMSAATLIDTTIIGAGWSGLVAALRLAQAGNKVLVLEARERIGGRAFTHTWNKETAATNARTAAPNAEGTVWGMDFGSSWVHGYNEGNPARKLAEQYGVALNVAKPTASRVVGPSGPLPDELAGKLGKNLGAAQAQVAKEAQSDSGDLQRPDVSLADRLFADGSKLFDGLSGEEKELAKDFARLLHVPIGTTLEHAAFRWNGFERNFAGTDAAPEGGFTNFISKIADDAKKHGVEFKTSQVVKQIKLLQEGGKSRVSVTTEGLDGKGQGATFESKSVLCTIPLAVLKEVSQSIFEPALPARRKAVIDRTNVGNLNKVLLSYDNVWWDQKVGMFTILPTSRDKLDLQTAALEEVLANCTILLASSAAPSGLPERSNSLLAMIGADHAKALERFSRSEIEDALHAYISKRLGQPNAPKPNHSFYSRWHKQQFTRGATTTPLVVGEHNSPLDFIELSRPLWSGALNFAGEHTDFDHHGSIAGAIVSGEREGKRIAEFLEAQARQASL